MVGGAVRDELLGLEVRDRDHVVGGATPAEMVRRGYRPVGAAFTSACTTTPCRGS